MDEIRHRQTQQTHRVDLKHPAKKDSPTNQHQLGFSLVSMLVAMSISGFITLAALQQATFIEKGRSSLKVRQNLLSVRNTVLQQMDCQETLKNQSTSSTSCLNRVIPLLTKEGHVINPTQGAAVGGMIGEYNVIARCDSNGQALDITWKLPGAADQITGENLNVEKPLFGKGTNFCSPFFHSQVKPPQLHCFTLTQYRSPWSQRGPLSVSVMGNNFPLIKGIHYRELLPTWVETDPLALDPGDRERLLWGLECGRDTVRTGCTARSDTNEPVSKDLYFTTNGCRLAEEWLVLSDDESEDEWYDEDYDDDEWYDEDYDDDEWYDEDYDDDEWSYEDEAEDIEWDEVYFWLQVVCCRFSRNI